MRRRTVITLIVAGVAVFLVISALLARALSVGGAEDAAITDLVRAEARGDPAAVAALIHGCSADAACRARAQADAVALRHSGSISIAQITPSTSFSLGGTLGTARVAWVAGNSLPRVQCVRVRHVGNVLDGFSIQLVHVSLRIKSDIDCPRTY